MDWSTLLFLALTLLLLLGLLIYWLIWLTEGAYLGSWAVRWLYDQGASSYDGVKQYNPADEAAFLAHPLFHRFEESFGPHSLLLDVATGTARLPLALFSVPFYEGEIIGLDISRPMLAEAAAKCADEQGRITFIHHPSVPLPFEDESFDAVSSLEALEFMPDRQAALHEMVRVLAPGGWLILSNRIGVDARLMPGRTDSPQRFERVLEALGLIEVQTRPWQAYYDLVFARKAGAARPGRGFCGAWLQALRCPHCQAGGSGVIGQGQWQCTLCNHVIDIGPDGVWEFGKSA